MNCTIYLGCKMTDLFCDDMIDKAQETSVVFAEAGLNPVHPILNEGLPYVHKKLKDRTPEEMDVIWRKDKQYIKDAHVVVDTSPHVYSAGLKEEMGKARYRDWKPTVAIFPKGWPVRFITRAERDLVTDSEEVAASYIAAVWGTRWKRMKWRFPIYLRHWPDISLRKLIQFFK